MTRGQIVSMRNNSRTIAIATAFKTAIALELDLAQVVAALPWALWHVRDVWSAHAPSIHG